MREIKARYWDKDYKKFRTGTGCILDINGLHTTPELEASLYTGLKDKNGVEIYEGDVLSVDWKDKRYPVHTIGPVEWDMREACWQLGEGGQAWSDARNYMEVIGNIYENPELLESK